MNEPMPWRLQIATMAMQGDWAARELPERALFPYVEERVHPVFTEYMPDSTFQKAAKLYFRMADAMLAEHARTAQVSTPTQKDREHIQSLITDLRKEGSEIASRDLYGWGNLMNGAADELERMLKE